MLLLLISLFDPERHFFPKFNFTEVSLTDCYFLTQSFNFIMSESSETQKELPEMLLDIRK